MELNFKDVEKYVPNIKVVGVSSEATQETCVGYEFTGGIYKGVVYTYYNVRFNVYDVENDVLTKLTHEDIDPDDEKYALNIAFDYLIFSNKNDKNTDDKPFKEYIGSILVQFINGALDE